MTPEVRELLDYTMWQRELWHAWFRREGSAGLGVTTGPHGDGRMKTVGELIRHIFSAELRYVERILSRPLTDTASISRDDVEALFQFGARSRGELVTLLDTLPGAAWDEPSELSLAGYTMRVTPRKIVLHVLTHEIRHWAQVGTLLRLQGLKGDPQDLLLSPVLGGETGAIGR